MDRMPGTDMAEAASDLQTEMLLLRISPCRETGAVVTGISPELGRMAFYRPDFAGVNRRTGEAPCDLFQCLALKCRPAKKNGDEDDFYRIIESELVVDFSSLSADYEAYQAACWLAAFSVRNVMPHIAMPKYYESLKTGLGRMASREAFPECVLTGAGLVFLYEAGWLDMTAMSSNEVSQCETLINMALGLGEMPALSRELWQRLWNWTSDRLHDYVPE